MKFPIVIESSCSDNDGTARAEFAARVHSLHADDLAAAREAGCKVVLRSADGARASLLGFAPGLVALLLESSDGVLIMPAAAFAEAWG